MKFIKATEEYNTFEAPVPAPYIRKSFFSDSEQIATITIAVCGFYEIYLNGTRFTKGRLAPYISNPCHFIYADEYKVKLCRGENVVGLILGNGFQNNPGGHIWDFDKACWRSAPMAAIKIVFKDSCGNEVVLESDKSFKTHPSPIVSDDYRFGEHYDARREIGGWCEVGFDDSKWRNALVAVPPEGEIRLCPVEPIKEIREIAPIQIIRGAKGFIYDFGENIAGVCRLCINGKKDKKITLRYGETIKDGEIDLTKIWFVREFWDRDREIVHLDTYICRGEKEEYTPTFTYHGFRYVEVGGITPDEATEDLLHARVLHSDIKSRGGFTCSDATINKLWEITRRSDLSNFHYFPTDCPQREKNGWTADAALSAEHMLLSFTVEKSLAEWQKNICMAQDERGALPGIVPTDTWGFAWGNGPAWDSVIAWLPYYVYVLRGQTDMIKDSANALEKYLRYLLTRTDDKGLIHIGLGDWCHVGGGAPRAPLELTDTVMSMDIAKKCEIMFDAVGMKERSLFARETAESLRDALRRSLIDFDTMTAAGSCQSSQAMCLWYNVFDECEEEKAFARLVEMIDEKSGFMDVGVLGGRVIFHTLSRFGKTDLAYDMITRPEYPSYGNWLERGATTLWENFHPDSAESMNHHFWGDVSAWFVKSLAGLVFNPDGRDVTRVNIKPSFATKLDFARAEYDSPLGMIVSGWERQDNTIILRVQIPENMSARAILDDGFVFENGSREMQVCSGEYRIFKKGLCT